MGRLIVNPVPPVFVARMIAGGAVGAVLQVTLRRVPSSATATTIISEFAVTAVVLIVQVPAEAFVAHEKAPAAAAVQATIEGLAAVPTTAQLLAVAKSLPDTVPAFAVMLPEEEVIVELAVNAPAVDTTKLDAALFR